MFIAISASSSSRRGQYPDEPLTRGTPANDSYLEVALR
jgi:hypothetical protein